MKPATKLFTRVPVRVSLALLPLSAFFLERARAPGASALLLLGLGLILNRRDLKTLLRSSWLLLIPAALAVIGIAVYESGSGGAGSSSGEGARWARLYPFLMSVAGLAAFLGPSPKQRSERAEPALLERILKRFVPSMGAAQRAAVPGLQRFWVRFLSANSVVLFALIFVKDPKPWLIYSSGIFYLLLSSMILLTVLRLKSADAGIGPATFLGLRLRQALGFGIFGCMCLGFLPVLMLMRLVLFRRPQAFRKASRFACRKAFAFVFRYLRLLDIVEVRRFDRSGGEASRIMVANHISMFDVMILIASIPDCMTFVKSRFLRNPLIRPIALSCGYVGVAPGLASRLNAYEQAVRLIGSGHRLLVFPEGTRSRDGKLGSFEKGIFRIALESGIPLTPVFLTSDRPVFSNAQGKVELASRGLARIDVHMMPAVAIEAWSADRKGIAALRDHVHALFEGWMQADFALAWSHTGGESKWRIR